MIVQGFLNFLSSTLGTLLASIPPLPAELFTAMTFLSDGGHFVSDHISNFSPIIPFTAIGVVMAWWAAGLAFFAGILLVRLVLLVVNR